MILLLVCSAASARHITGGELSYILTSSSGGSNVYQVTLRLYRDCFSSGAQLDNVAFFGVFAKTASGTSLHQSLTANMNNRETLTLRSPGKCIDNPPSVCYEVGIYTFTVNLPASTYGYTISYQRCCRIENISNVSGSGQIGATYTAEIPGTLVHPEAPKNSSANFWAKDTVVVCEDNYFAYDFGATDRDGDSLSYSLCSAYSGGSSRDPQPNVPTTPPHSPVPYSYGFSASSPMGANVTINSKTGLVSGVAPAAGIYVVTVCVSEIRNGIVINVHRKDIQIKVASCSIASATLLPEYVNCDSFTVSFQNRSSSPLIRSYYWDFGDTRRSNDFSTEARPTYTYQDTGTYRVKLVTNRGEECADSTFTIVKVYPGFNADFSFSEGCKDVAIFFNDRTTARYGVVNSWQWDFGVTTVGDDVSTSRNNSYTYTTSGTYNVSLIVGTNKGCSKTVVKELVVRDKPLLTVPKDTLMCDVDTIAITANGAPGTYTWSPAYNISPTSGATVMVSPDRTTDYVVSLTTVPGCTSLDTITVNVVSFVTLEAGAGFTMCLTDSVQLKPFSNGLRYEWEPVATMADATVKEPFVTPVDPATVYSVTSYIGKCFARDELVIRTVPYPEVRVSPDTAICYGDKISLFAEGGANYQWTPLTGLRGASSPTPEVSPPVTTIYTVSVTDILGCPKPTEARVVVTVIPPVPAFAGNDTVAVLDQPLQLQATGAEFYKWSPAGYLSKDDIANPIATFVSDVGDRVTYAVKVSTPEGCYAYDTVTVRIFRTAPDIFVATAFTPDGDGLNDEFRALPVGIKLFEYLKLYNRWGQLMFSTNDPSRGWDGKYNGVQQATDTFVWMVKGTDYLGRPIVKKGTMVLMR